jgi:hypothetical protein
MDQSATSTYRPRRPEQTDLHLAVRENLKLFCDTRDERFLEWRRRGEIVDAGKGVSYPFSHPPTDWNLSPTVSTSLIVTAS